MRRNVVCQPYKRRFAEKPCNYCLSCRLFLFRFTAWALSAPRRPGRKSHYPLLAVLAELPLVLHGWLRSGNSGAARGVVAFLCEALALLPHLNYPG